MLQELSPNGNYGELFSNTLNSLFVGYDARSFINFNLVPDHPDENSGPPDPLASSPTLYSDTFQAFDSDEDELFQGYKKLRKLLEDEAVMSSSEDSSLDDFNNEERFMCEILEQRKLQNESRLFNSYARKLDPPSDIARIWELK